DLRRADGHHARQGPTGKRVRALLGTGRQQDGPTVDAARSPVLRKEDTKARLDLPDLRAKEQLSAALAQGLGGGRALEVIWPHCPADGGAGIALDPAPDLAAEDLLFVDDADAQTLHCRHRRAGHTGRASANDDQVVVAGGLQAHGWSLWVRRSIRIPSSTGIRQDCTAADPSTRTRHSKQTPIMQ